MHEKILDKFDHLDSQSLRKVLEGSLNQTDLLREVVQTFPQAVYVLDDQLEIAFLNNLAKKYVKPCKRYEGKKLTDIIDEPHFFNELKKLINQLPRVGHAEFSPYEEPKTSLVLSVFPLWSSNDGKGEKGEKENQNLQSIKGVTIFLADTTSLRQNCLRENQRNSILSLSQLVAGIAHEIKNPLGALDLHMQLISRFVDNHQVENKSELTELLDIVRDEISRLDEIANDFLYTFRLQTPRRKPHNINKIVSSTAELLKPKLAGKKIELHLNLDENVKPFLLDENQMHQVLINLLENSLYAISQTDRTGEIVITTKDSEKCLWLSIYDNGIGIDKQKISEIFDPFYTNKKMGTGLGLSIVSHIVDNHDGKILVDSKLNEGTTFTIKLSRVSPNKKLLKNPHLENPALNNTPLKN